LKTDGKVLLTTPYIGSLDSRLRFLFTGRFSYFPESEREHINPIPSWELERILLENQFEIEEKAKNGGGTIDKLLGPLLSLFQKDASSLTRQILIVKARLT
jgi:hypothetical protein